VARLDLRINPRHVLHRPAVGQNKGVRNRSWGDPTDQEPFLISRGGGNDPLILAEFSTKHHDTINDPAGDGVRPDRLVIRFEDVRVDMGWRGPCKHFSRRENHR
jgi:hypothetical protein